MDENNSCYPLALAVFITLINCFVPLHRIVAACKKSTAVEFIGEVKYYDAAISFYSVIFLF